MKLTLSFLFIPIFLFSQGMSPETDSSIQKQITSLLEKNDTKDIDYENALELVETYLPVSPDTGLMIVDHLLGSLQGNSDSPNLASLLVLKGKGHHGLGQQKEAIENYRRAQDVAKIIGLPSIRANAAQLEAGIYQEQGDLESAIDGYIQAAELFDTLGNDQMLGEAFVNISGIYFDQNNLDKSRVYIKKVRELGEKINDPDLKTHAAGLEAVNSMTKGILYYFANEADTANMSKTMDTLMYYFRLSEKQYEAALPLANEAKDKTLKITILNNYVALMLNMDNYDMAEILSKQALKASEETGDLNLITQSTINLGSYYRKVGNYNQAENFGQEGLRLATEYGQERKIYMAHIALFELYSAQENWKKAITSQDHIRTYENMISDKDRAKAIAEVEARYQTAVKENEILELENKARNAAQQRNGILAGTCVGGLLLFFGFSINKIRKERNNKIELAKALLFTQEEERKRIAQDLHDGIGQSLLLIKKKMDDTESATIENRKLIGDTLEEVRAISQGLHPFQLEKFGLTASLNEMVDKVGRSTGIFMTKEITDVDNSLSDIAEIHTYRAVQEALNNIIKHSEASAAKLNVSSDGKYVHIEIRDNGKGFDYDDKLKGSKSLGLKTMSERIQSIGGKFKVSSIPSSGMKIQMDIPTSA